MEPSEFNTACKCKERFLFTFLP